MAESMAMCNTPNPMTEQKTFEALSLNPSLLRALRDRNYKTTTPIQEQAIPAVLNGHDLLASAQTGTGKTAAFSLPILHRLNEDLTPMQPHQMRALIITPTRELAVQVADSFKAYGRHLNLSHALVYGGVSMSQQIKSMRGGVDILVATTGRLLDLHQQGYVDFSRVQTLVLDEADRMLDMGFIDDIRKIVGKMPKNRQSLFFSATFSPPIEKLSREILSNPVEVRIAQQTKTAENVDHRVCFTRNEHKHELLTHMLEQQDNLKGKNLALVFSRTKHGSDRLAKMLGKQGIRADSIHGDKSQAARQRALSNFRDGKCKVLVATDVASRGIDIKSINLVINYDLPDEAGSYIHRIGRTARAGEQGYARSFCTGENLAELRAIERLIGKSVQHENDHPFHCQKTESRHTNPPAKKKKSSPQKSYNPRKFSTQERANKSKKRNRHPARGK